MSIDEVLEELAFHCDFCRREAKEKIKACFSEFLDEAMCEENETPQIIKVFKEQIKYL